MCSKQVSIVHRCPRKQLGTFPSDTDESLSPFLRKMIFEFW